MRSRILPVLAAGLVLVGCGGTPKEEADAPETSAAAESSVKGRVDAEAPADGPGGTMIVTYEDADSPEAIAGRAIQQENRMLEDLADDINQTLVLPHDITLRGARGGSSGRCELWV